MRRGLEGAPPLKVLRSLGLGALHCSDLMTRVAAAPLFQIVLLELKILQLTQWFSRCGPGAQRQHPWKPVRDAQSWASPQTHGIRL